MDATFQADMLNCRGHMTEEDLHELFERHRRERETLIRKKTSDRQDLESKMNAKLAERMKKMVYGTT